MSDTFQCKLRIIKDEYVPEMRYRILVQPDTGMIRGTATE